MVMRKYVQRLIVACAAAMLAGGCVMIPEYHQPQAKHVPDSWPDGPAYPDFVKGKPERPASAIGWRDFFTDARLKGFIAQALENNPDIRLAILKVKRLRAKYQLQQAKLFPQVNATGSYTRRNRSSVRGTRAAGGGAFDYYQVGVGITSYEIDLFGRIQSLKKSALERYLATVHARRSAKIALVAQVANAYLQWIAYDARLGLAKKTLAGRKKALSLIHKRFDVGVASELALRQAQTAYQSVRVEVAKLRRQRAQARNALVALVGSGVPQQPAQGVSLDDDMTIDLPEPGLSSRLLLRRPDVIAAEHRLKAANAKIGAARAAFFPRITLVGSYGSISPELDGLFEAGTTIWSFMPKITIPIFDGGRNEAKLQMAKVTKRMKVAKYEKTIRTAFREVANTLAARGTLNETLAARRKLVDAARASYQLARQRYKHGVSSYLPVLEAQRSLYDARQSLIKTKMARIANTVTLYKVLGGGWREHTRQKPDSKHSHDNPVDAAGQSPKV